MVNALGKYELLERIGHGATGRVWRARHVDTGALVAVKVLREELADDPDVRTRFLREGAVLTGRDLPGVVRVHETVVERDRVGLVMDLIDGPNLREVISLQAPLQPARACALALQMATSLHAAQRAGLVHRDVKPENVLVHKVRGSELALLTDFGLARVLDEAPNSGSRSRAFGTPHYVAPERLRRGPVGPAVDVYALGVILFEMVVGWRPFRSQDPAALMLQQLNEIPLRPPGVSEDLWALIDVCLAKDPQDRPATSELAARLESLAESLAGAPALLRTDPPTEEAVTFLKERANVETPATKMSGLRGRKRVWIAAATACILAAGTVAFAASTWPPAGTSALPGATTTEAQARTTAPVEASPSGVPSITTPPGEGLPTAIPATELPTTDAPPTSAPGTGPPARVPATKAPATTTPPLKAPTILTRRLPDGTVGRSYSTVLSGRGQKPLTWKLIGGAMPSKTSLSSSGRISGGPISGEGNAVFRVKLIDGNGLASTRSFSISSIRLRSDINRDGEVDCGDLAILKKNFFNAGTFSQGDINNDNTINALDLSMMMSDWTGRDSTC